MKKLTVFLFVLIFAVTLAFTSCGGEKQPELTQDAATTTEPTVTTTAAATTTKATTTTVATTTAAPAPATTTIVAVVTRAPIETTEKVANPDDYRALYVKDGAVLLADYYAATPDMEIMKSLVWKDETLTCADRFVSPAKMHADYIWHVESTYRNRFSALSGGTCALVFPYIDRANNVVDTVADYYVSGAGTPYAKNTYPSYWGDRYLGLGFNTTLSLAAIQKDFAAGDGYTVQVFASFLPEIGKDSVSGQCVLMFGPTRVNVSVSEMDVIYTKVYYHNLETGGWSSPDTYSCGDFYYIDGYAPVTYTVALTNPPTNATEYTDSTLDLYINTTLSASGVVTTTKNDEGTFKIGEGADSQIYAVRIYKRTLTEDEIKQNHFADLALYFGLDIDGFADLRDAKKTAAYEALAAMNTATPKADVEAAYKAAIK